MSRSKSLIRTYNQDLSHRDVYLPIYCIASVERLSLACLNVVFAGLGHDANSVGQAVCGSRTPRALPQGQGLGRQPSPTLLSTLPPTDTNISKPTASSIEDVCPMCASSRENVTRRTFTDINIRIQGTRVTSSEVAIFVVL